VATAAPAEPALFLPLLGGLLLLLISLIVIFFQGLPYFKLSHIFFVDTETAMQNLFLPYGALLFSLWGIGLIPETEEMLKGKKANLKKIVIISTLIVSVFYLLFIFFMWSSIGAAR
jgi:amino acid transporter